MEGILPEGAEINRPPNFSGEHYSSWKAKFRVFIMGSEFGLWNVFENGDYKPSVTINGAKRDKHEEEYDENDRRQVTLNMKAIHMLRSALSPEDYSRICTLPSAKAMWDAIKIAHEDEAEKEDKADIYSVAQEEESESEEVNDLESSYDELFSEYNELYSEYEKLAKEFIASKKKIKLLEEQVQNVSSSVSISKNISVSSCENNSENHCENISEKVCDNCCTLEKRNLYLTKTLEKFTRDSEMLKVILKQQRFTNDKSGIGYEPDFDKKKGKKKHGQKSYLNYFQKSVHTSNPFAQCNYCNRKGHNTSSCFHRKNRKDKPVGNYQWVPKGTYIFPKVQTNPEGPKHKRVPKCPSVALFMQVNSKRNGHTEVKNQRISYKPKRRTTSNKRTPRTNIAKTTRSNHKKQWTQVRGVCSTSRMDYHRVPFNYLEKNKKRRIPCEQGKGFLQSTSYEKALLYPKTKLTKIKYQRMMNWVSERNPSSP